MSHRRTASLAIDTARVAYRILRIYVNLHVRGRDYPLRTTITAIEAPLDPGQLVRVHRSYVVNPDCIDRIEPLDTSDARIVLRDEATIPCSRRYRGALRVHPGTSDHRRRIGGSVANQSRAAFGLFR